jgi:murein DD-endopeptidase MepM/ murein hydrolase activator NlpD
MFRLLLAMAVVAALGLSSQAAPAAQKHAVRKTPARVVIPCGSGASLSLTSTTASQGSLLLVDLSIDAPLQSVHAKWGTKEISFWQKATPASAVSKTQHWRTLVAVDLDKPVGDYPVDVSTKPTAEPAAEAPAACQLTVHVIAGKFATENLHVDNKFVEPDPEQAARAKAEQQKLGEIYATVSPQKLWQGRFRIPLDGVTKGANFGRRRVLNGKPGSPHGGVDLPATTGTPVHASQTGRVVLAEPLFFAGNTVIIDHGLGIYTLYCHLSEIGAKVGDKIAVGAVLGKVGATGRVTGPHLHWGLSVDRSRVNALQIVTFAQL